MKKFSLVATCMASLLAVNHLAPSASGQQQRPPATTVAIIDVGYVFKYHTRMQTLTADMQRDIQAAEKEMQEARESFHKLTTRLEEYKKGSPEFKSLEEELAKRQADLQLQINIQKRNFAEQQAKIFMSVYREVTDEVKTYCDGNGIGLVLRFNGDPVDLNDPEEVFRELNRTVVFYQPTIDITPIILRNLNSRMGPPPTAQQPGQAPQGATRPSTGIPPRRS